MKESDVKKQQIKLLVNGLVGTSATVITMAVLERVVPAPAGRIAKFVWGIGVIATGYCIGNIVSHYTEDVMNEIFEVEEPNTFVFIGGIPFYKEIY